MCVFHQVLNVPVSVREKQTKAADAQFKTFYNELIEFPHLRAMTACQNFPSVRSGNLNCPHWPLLEQSGLLLL